MAIDINPKDVKFYNYENIINDSLNKKGGNNYSTSPDIPTLRRLKNSYQNTNYEMMMDYFLTTPKIKWIGSWRKKPKLRTIHTSKSDNRFGGRHWTAWFCKDINISEGPYKFEDCLA
jgi:GLPGLI family protein